VVATIGLLAALGVALAVVLRAHEAPDVAASLVRGGADSVSSKETAWPWLAVAGALVSAAVSVVTLRQAGRWPEMSSRYDAPAGEAATTSPPAPEEATSADLWKAMDEGRDPTE
jgi:uncharacterized membrane protein (TIGR02234 family)